MSEEVKTIEFEIQPNLRRLVRGEETVLQQMWFGIQRGEKGELLGMQTEWRDVPLVTE